MSTPPVPTKPEAERRPDNRPAAPKEEPVAPAPEVLDAVRDDRTVDADLLIDIPQLSVEELSLELDASLLLDHVKLDAKGLEASLYVKADFGHLYALARQGDRGGRGSFRQRGADMMRARTGLRELLGSADDADAQDSVAEEPQRGPSQPEQRGGEGHDGQPHGAGERARHAVAQGAKAAGLTAAGLAGGALLESRVKPSRKLHLPRRRTRARFIRDELAKRLS